MKPSRSLIPITILLFAAFSLVSNAQEFSPDIPRKADTYISEILKTYEFPGFAVGIIVDGEVALAKGYGVLEVHGQHKITTETLFHMASVAKPFVGTAIMQLVESGKLNLDSPVVNYLPYFKLRGDRYKEITIRQMLNHVSGMPDVDDYEWDHPQFDDGALERYVKSLSDRSLVAAPGEETHYSNMAYDVLGDVIAKVSGESFEDYMQKHIFNPAEMKSSTFLFEQVDKNSLAHPHVTGSDLKPKISTVFPYNRIHAPSSTLYSNVEDMLQWARINMDMGNPQKTHVLNTSSYEQMWGSEPGGGLGWSVGEYRGYSVALHSGSDVGFKSFLLLIPEKKIAVVLMCNYSLAPIGDILNGILTIIWNSEPEPLVIPLVSVLFPIARYESVENAISTYRKIKAEQPGRYLLDESQLDIFGSYLLEVENYDRAIEVFRLNSEAYPKSASTFNKLGGAYMLSGNKPQAIIAYENALKANPSDATALEMLQKLRNEK